MTRVSEKELNKRLSIAVFSGATATIQNTPPLVTGSSFETERSPSRKRPLRAQRLATEVTVYIEAFSAHPLEEDAKALYAAPDGYIDSTGAFHTERHFSDDVPVFKATLRPDDGLYLLPYLARQADGSTWDNENVRSAGSISQIRQTFYPDGSRLFEEIDRFGLDDAGHNNVLSRHADFDFVRAAPSGGYTRGLPENRRTDAANGDIPCESGGKDFFFYSPPHLARHPPSSALARLTNAVQSTLNHGRYDGAIWLEGSASIEETLYWLNLVIDTDIPLCGTAAQRPHGSLSSDGDRNIVDALTYLRSSVWADRNGKDRVGAVLVQDELIFAAREVHKVAARPGGYEPAGGFGGILGSVGSSRGPTIEWISARLHTSQSAVNLRKIPVEVTGVQGTPEDIQAIPVLVKSDAGHLLDNAVPKVTLCKHSRYGMDSFSDGPGQQAEIMERIRQNLLHFSLSGFVLEGNSPYGHADESMTAALEFATLCGMPVVCVGRGNTAGEASLPEQSLFISGSNLSATKARMLLIACLLRFGAAPLASDPKHPTKADRASTDRYLQKCQEVFDTH